MCTKIVASALITLSTPGGQQYRRLLSVTTTPDWYTPEAHKRIRSALTRPIMLPRPTKKGRGLLQTAEETATPTSALSGTSVGVDRSAIGITPSSILCLEVFGSTPDRCAMLVTQVCSFF